MCLCIGEFILGFFFVFYKLMLFCFNEYCFILSYKILRVILILIYEFLSVYFLIIIIFKYLENVIIVFILI